MPPQTPGLPAVRVLLTLSGGQAGGLFSACGGLDSESEVLEQTVVDPAGHSVIRKVPGASKWSDITLARAVDAGLDLWHWRATVLESGAEQARSDGTIEMFDANGDVVAAYAFRAGWPVKYVGASFDAASSDVTIEEIVICHDGLERTR
jgi:phage tail-like protein